MIKNYYILDEFEGTRLDRWFKKKICKIPQSLLEKNIRKGNIKVNNKRSKSSYKLKLKDKITIVDFNPKIIKTNKEKFIYRATKKEVKSTSDFIIEDNENFIVINKPAGIAVQSGTKSQKNIIDIMRMSKYFYNGSPFIVHRIDKETTGVLIIAKNRKYAQLFTSLFRIRKIHKTYLGIVIGEFPKKNGTLTNLLTYYEGNKELNVKAITHYKVIDSNNNFSFLKLTPITGRKHQLRRQLLECGHPILGDSKYRFENKKISKKSNLMLHAYKINFSINDFNYEYVAEPNNIFKNFLNEKYLKNSL